jgi:hypothetical protein
VLVIAITRISTAAFWRNGSPSSRRNIGHVAALILIGRRRASARLHSNSSPIASASSTTGIGLQAIVERDSMRWRNRSPARGGSRCRPLLEQARLPTWRL